MSEKMRWYVPPLSSRRQTAPAWASIAGRLLSFVAQRRLAKEEQARGLTSLYDKIRYLTDQGLYGSYILENYSREEIDQAASWLDRTRDELLDYPGLDLLLKRYVICSHDHVPLESPQEMFMGIALHLALRERPEARMGWVRRFYDMLSRLEVTMATPTMSNARKPHHQLSSCFIDTVPDSLEGIYRSVDNFAMVSKFGGGMGMYLGKVRAKGGSIRGFEGAAGGVVRWIRVDQRHRCGCGPARRARRRRGRLPGRLAPRSAGVPATTHQQRRRPHEGARRLPGRLLPRPLLAHGRAGPRPALAPHVPP